MAHSKSSPPKVEKKQVIRVSCIIPVVVCKIIITTVNTTRHEKENMTYLSNADNFLFFCSLSIPVFCLNIYFFARYFLNVVLALSKSSVSLYSVAEQYAISKSIKASIQFINTSFKSCCSRNLSFP